MKPVEPGCLAIIIKSEIESRLGMPVLVVRPAPSSGFVAHPNGNRSYLDVTPGVWEVDADIPNSKGLPWFAHESQLMRIDGGDELVEQDEQEELTA